MSANKEPLLKALSEPIPHVPVEEPSTASQAYIYDRADRLTCGYDATIINSDDERRNAEHIDSGGNSHHIDSGGNNCHIDSAGSNRPNRADGNKDNCNLHTGLRRNTRSRTVGNSRGHNRTHHSIRRNTARLPTAVRFQALAQSRPSPIHHNGRHASRQCQCCAFAAPGNATDDPSSTTAAAIVTHNFRRFVRISTSYVGMLLCLGKVAIPKTAPLKRLPPVTVSASPRIAVVSDNELPPTANTPPVSGYAGYPRQFKKILDRQSRNFELYFGAVERPTGNSIIPTETPHRMSASLIGRSGSSTFRLSTTAVSMSLAGSCFSSESAPRPFHHGIRRRGGTIFGAALPSE